MGKVASSSIFSSLTKQYSGAVGHAHHIGDDNWMSVELYQWSLDNNPLKIITLIREPIGRNVSAFFQLFEGHTGTSFDKSTLTTDELKELFLDNLDHDRPISWFDKNIKKHFGIDVYSKPFPEQKFITFKKNNVSLLLLRFDLEDSTKESLIRDFLDFPEFKIKRANLSSKKDYFHTYKDFQKNVKLPESYLDKMCDSTYFKHFFPKEEIEQVRSRWEIKK